MATNPKAARLYLDGMLAAAGIPYSRVSIALGHNAAYIQQYIKRGKPPWLSEVDRNALVQLISGLDPEELRPPLARPLTAKLEHKRKVNAPGFGKFVEDPRKLALLEIYDALSPERQDYVFDSVRRLADMKPLPRAS